MKTKGTKPFDANSTRLPKLEEPGASPGTGVSVESPGTGGGTRDGALKALGLGPQKVGTTSPNAGAESVTLGAKLMGLAGSVVTKAVAAVGIGICLLGAVPQKASADVVLVQHGSSRHMQDVARQLAGETGEGFVHLNASGVRAAFQRIENGQGDADHLILEGNVNVDELAKLRSEFPNAFESVRYVHVVGTATGTATGGRTTEDPFAGRAKELFPNAVSVVSFSVPPGPASAWLVQQSGRQLYNIPGNGLSPQNALIQARMIANNASKLGVSSSVQVQDQVAAAVAQSDKPDIQLTYTEAQRQNSSEIVFTVPHDMRSVKDGQSVLIPLEGGRTIHMIELRYQDTRPLRDLEFNRRVGNGEWETFRGDELKATEAKEKAGEAQIKREPDHNSPWINNPIRVVVEIVDADGNVIHAAGKKFLDPHVHDAWSADGPGSPETDNISRSYESLPDGKLPDGAQLRLTPVHTNKKPWEADRTIAMDISWVKPIYMPEHTARAMVREGGWEKPSQQGYTVDANRPIAAVFVKWTDHGGTASGSVRMTGPDGKEFRSQSYNVGSGETELIPLDGAISKDGKIYIEGWGLEVGNIEVLYK